MEGIEEEAAVEAVLKLLLLSLLFSSMTMFLFATEVGRETQSKGEAEALKLMELRTEEASSTEDPDDESGLVVSLCIVNSPPGKGEIVLDEEREEREEREEDGEDEALERVDDESCALVVLFSAKWEGC